MGGQSDFAGGSVQRAGLDVSRFGDVHHLALKPHATDGAAGPRPQIDARVLAGILPPVHAEQSDVRDRQQPKDEQDEILPQPQRIEVSSVGGQEGE